MIKWTMIGTVAFALLILFEVRKCQFVKTSQEKVQHFAGNPWFVVGTGMLLFACVMLGTVSGYTVGIRFWTGIAVLAAGLFAYGKVLAVAEPEGYIRDGKKQPVNRKGCYSWMRHPGVWTFLICAVGYGLVFEKAMLPVLWFAFLNGIYTWLQDRYFFPVYLEGYGEYQKEVPFLFPRKNKR